MLGNIFIKKDYPLFTLKSRIVTFSFIKPFEEAKMDIDQEATSIKSDPLILGPSMMIAAFRVPVVDTRIFN